VLVLANTRPQVPERSPHRLEPLREYGCPVATAEEGVEQLPETVIGFPQRALRSPQQQRWERSQGRAQNRWELPQEVVLRWGPEQLRVVALYIPGVVERWQKPEPSRIPVERGW